MERRQHSYPRCFRGHWDKDHKCYATNFAYWNDFHILLFRDKYKPSLTGFWTTLLGTRIFLLPTISFFFCWLLKYLWDLLKIRSAPCWAMVAYTFNQKAEAGRYLWVLSQPVIQSEFQDSQIYTEKPCLKNRVPKEISFSINYKIQINDNSFYYKRGHKYTECCGLTLAPHTCNSNNWEVKVGHPKTLSQNKRKPIPPLKNKDKHSNYIIYW